MPHFQKLTELKEFKWALWGPLGASVIVAIIITVADYLSPETLQFCITSECVNDAIYRHKLSLGIAALVFPLVALVASNHRSIQTVAQIQAAEQKNSFENYLKHKDFFEDRIKKITDKNLEGIDLNKLYNVVFTKNNAKTFDPHVRGVNDFIFSLEESFIFLMRNQKEISYTSYLRFVDVFFRIKHIYSKYSGLKKNNKISIILDLKEIEEKIKSYYKLLIEINVLAFPEVDINMTNGFFTKHFDEIKNFKVLALDEDQDDSDGWGKQTFEFGYAFREMLDHEYKKNDMKLEHLKELYGEDDGSWQRDQ